MDWEKAYKEKLMSAEDAVKTVIHEGDDVYCAGGNAPGHLINTMFDTMRSGMLKGVTLHGNNILSRLNINDPGLTPEMVRYHSFFHGPQERANLGKNIVTFVPLQFSYFGRYLREVMKPTVGLLTVSPPDENGNFNIGPIQPGLGAIIVEECERIIVQVNKKQPRVYGIGVDVPMDRVAAIVEQDEDLPTYPMLESSDIDKAIANHILELVPDGACIQLGLGGMANAVGYGLESKKDLGMHTEMLTESMSYLIEKGIINNSRKNFMPDKMLAGFTLGDQKQYEYVRENPKLCFASMEITNSVKNIAQNDNMISINTALAVDLTGQICSESVGTRQFSGTGGQVDFIRGALASKNGKSFIAISSTYNSKEGPKSRISTTLAPGSAVTDLRAEIQYVVTEYGCVNLFGCDLPTRAKKLISIAHPDFREQLTFEAKKSGLLY